MINVLLNGFSSFQNHFWILFCILLAVIWGQAVMQMLLKKIFENQFDDGEYFSLSFAGWVLPLFCWAILYFLANLFFGKTFAIIISAILFVRPLLLIRFKKPSLQIILLIAFLFISLLLHLARLEQALLPSYFDSAEHYKNIQKILSIYENEPVSLFGITYYHLGYHFLSAALIHLLQWNIINFMLVFGQVIVAFLPISFFFLIKQITHSNQVAFFACLVAGFGLHMPAHLINWGKYPALLSLVGMQFIFCFVIASDCWSSSPKRSAGQIETSSAKQSPQKINFVFLDKNSFFIWLAIIFSIVFTALIHTRSFIAFAIIAISYLLTLLQKRLSPRFQYFTFAIIFIIFTIELFYIQQNNALVPLINGYMKNDVWLLFYVLLLLPFAIRFYPHFIYFLFTSLTVFIAVMFIPIQLPTYGILTLLDRPYVQMLAYIPITILASLGFSGILQAIQKILNARNPHPAFIIPEGDSHWERGKSSRLNDFLIGVRVFVKSEEQFGLTYITTLIFFGFVILNANFNYRFYPSACCQLASRDDLTAISWVEKNIPTHEKILIAVSQLSVTSYEMPAPAAVDAGIWLTPLTGRATPAAFININFETNDIHVFLCAQIIKYIYVGSLPNSFKKTQLTRHPHWYQPVFLLPTAQVYQVIGC